MWWVKDPDRLKREVAGIDALVEEQPWLSAATPLLLKDLVLALNFDIVVANEAFPFRLVYPAFFPEAPPLIIPGDGQRLSGHQYGVGGELCLEFRADNWDPSITGAMMIESAHRLLSVERSPPEKHSIVPSAHSISLGQQLRGWNFRFLLTRSAIAYIADLPVGSYREANVIDIPTSKSTWTAYIKCLGHAGAPDWQEAGIPDRGEESTQAVLVRVESLAAFPILPEQLALDQIIRQARGQDGTPLFNETGKRRFTVIADNHSATMFYSYFKDEGWCVFPYRTVHLADNVGDRLPESYCALAPKKVGIVGCGSLGSKIAASLARSGVSNFVLVDDDILKPGNLVRHELDVGSLGAHKADGLGARLKAIRAGVNVSTRRVALGGQESSGSTASVLDELATCDLLIDATANSQAFNFVASVASNVRRPMLWAEVYAGGIGGFVARLRPVVDPPPLYCPEAVPRVVPRARSAVVWTRP